MVLALVRGSIVRGVRLFRLSPGADSGRSAPSEDQYAGDDRRDADDRPETDGNRACIARTQGRCAGDDPWKAAPPHVVCPPLLDAARVVPIAVRRRENRDTCRDQRNRRQHGRSLVSRRFAGSR